MTVHAVIGVNISVGNAAVQTTEDVAGLLAKTALQLRLKNWSDIDQHSLAILDDNGNRVGYLQVTGYEETEDDEDDEPQVVRGFPYKPGAF